MLTVVTSLTNASTNTEVDRGIDKVGGLYKVESIKKKGTSYFEVRFKSTNKTGKFDTLILESDHVHVGVAVGMTLRLSAEILKAKGDTAEISQVLLFFKRGDSTVPVWLLSRKGNPGLRGARYLEMHAPTSDYVIF